MSLPRDKPSSREFLQSSVIYSAFHISYLGSPKTSVHQDVFHRRSWLCVRELRRSYGLSPRTWNPLCQVFSSTVFPVLSENPAMLISSTVILQLPRSNGLAVPWIPWHCVSSLPHILRGLCPFYNVRRCLWCSVRSRGECNSNLWRDTFIDSLTILNLQGTHLDHMIPNSSRHFHGLSRYPQHHFQALSFLFFLFCNPESLVSVSCWNVGLSCLILLRWPQLLWLQWLSHVQLLWVQWLCHVQLVWVQCLNHIWLVWVQWLGHVHLLWLNWLSYIQLVWVLWLNHVQLLWIQWLGHV